MTHLLSAINQMDESTFVALLGPVFEATPEIARAVWPQRPFQTRAELQAAMLRQMRSLPASEQLALIRAHPDLGTKAKMAEASVAEQSSAGLDQLSEAEFLSFQQLNQSYREKFEFPFIIAVRDHTKASILAAFQQRLQNSQAVEQAAALEQIGEIARLRLEAWVSDD